MSYHVVSTRTEKEALLCQGAIINGLRIPRYPPASVHCGLVLTARCDLEHLKAGVLNILPLVPLRQWTAYDALLAAVLARLDNIEGDIRLRAGRLDADLPYFLGESDWRSTLEAFEASFDRNTVNDLKVKAAMRDTLRWLAGHFPVHYDDLPSVAKIVDDPRLGLSKAVQGIVKRLLQNQVADAHFVPAISPKENLDQCEGYVVLFRHILAIPYGVVPLLARGGFTVSALDADLRDELAPVFALDSHADIGITSLVESPHVEHMMQRFAHLFTRIGVEDYHDDYMSRICAAVTEVRG